MRRRDISKALLLSAGAQPPPASAGAAAGAPHYYPSTPAEVQAAIAIPAMHYPPGDVRRFGAKGDGSTDDTLAIANANMVASLAAISGGAHPTAENSGHVFFPSGKYVYKPTSHIEISHEWIGESVESTIILCSTAAYAGEFFRIVGSCEVRNLFLLNDGLTRHGTGLRLAGRDALQFTGQLRITRVWIQGFAVNLQVDRAYMVTFDQVRSEHGAVGFYCEPSSTSPGSAAYVTTHLHINCYYAFNAINIYYKTEVAATNITFIGGANEGATSKFSVDGSTYSTYFGNIVNLHIIDWYCENQPAAIVIRNGRNVTFDGLYLNNTGGILLGKDVVARFINVRTTTAFDTVSGGDGTQRVSMEGCSWPKTGNSTNFASTTIFQSFVNGTYHECILPTLLSGSGSPEGNFAAPTGTLYLRSDGGAGSTLYVKESGNGVHGWTGK